MCLCPYMEREWWRLLQMSATQNLLPRSEVPCKDQNRHICCLALMAHIGLSNIRVVTTRTRNHLFFFNKFLRQSQSATPEAVSKKAKKIFHQWHNRADSPLVDTVIHNYGIEWAFDFGPDSGILTVKDLVQEMTISSQEITLPAWSLLLSRRQGFLNNHLARVPINPNQQGTLEMRYEVHWSVGARDMDTSGYQVSDLDSIESYWINDRLEVDALYRPGVDTLFVNSVWRLWDGRIRWKRHSPQRRELSSKNNSLWETNTSSALLRSRPFGTRIENAAYYVLRNLFQ